MHNAIVSKYIIVNSIKLILCIGFILGSAPSWICICPPPPELCCYIYVLVPFERNSEINPACTLDINMQIIYTQHNTIIIILSPFSTYTRINILLSQSITSLSPSFFHLLPPIISFLPPSDKSAISQRKKLCHLLYVHTQLYALPSSCMQYSPQAKFKA